MSSLQEDYPWTSHPLIAAAPMRLISLAPLAVEVSKAGGLGFIGAGSDLTGLNQNLAYAANLVSRDPKLKHIHEASGILPVGFGVLNWGADLDLAVAAVEKWNPAAVWFFAPREVHDLIEWTRRLRLAGKRQTKIWIQTGTVAEASEIVNGCRPDVLVVQGADAGGHGLEAGAGIIALLPEVADQLRSQGFEKIPLIAAGGIGDGRGVAAALALGAKGVVLGTRLLATTEAEISKGYQNAILAARDGGVNTVRTKVFDQLRGTTEWPKRYGGRSVINQSFLDHVAGVSAEDNRRLYGESLQKGDAGWGSTGRLTTYAGTVVGLIRSVKPAGDVVREVQQDAFRYLEKAPSSGNLIKAKI